MCGSFRSGYEKTRRRRALRRVGPYPRLSIRRASVGPSFRSIHHEGEYAPMLTESKPFAPCHEDEPAGFEERELRHHGAVVRYLVGGAGPPLALVHGLGGAASNWRLVAPALAAERRVIVPKLPGHGGSGSLPAASTLDSFAEAVLAVL